MQPALIPSEALEGLMKKVFVDTSLDIGLFWDAILRAHLYIPVSSAPESQGEPDFDPEKLPEIPVVLGRDSKGSDVLWLFTSPRVIVEYTEKDLPYLEFSAVKIFSSIKTLKYPIVLIGPNQVTLELDDALVRTLAEGKSPEPGEENIRYIPKDTQVMVGPATDEKAALEKKFFEFFQKLPEVLEAAFIQVSDDTGSRLLLGVKLSVESKEEFRRVAHLIATAAEGLLEKGKTMDITLMSGTLKDAFEKFGSYFYPVKSSL